MSGSGARIQDAAQSEGSSNPISNHAGSLHGPRLPVSSHTCTAHQQRSPLAGVRPPKATLVEPESATRPLSQTLPVRAANPAPWRPPGSGRRAAPGRAPPPFRGPFWGPLRAATTAAGSARRCPADRPGIRISGRWPATRYSRRSRQGRWGSEASLRIAGNGADPTRQDCASMAALMRSVKLSRGGSTAGAGTRAVAHDSRYCINISTSSSHSSEIISGLPRSSLTTSSFRRGVSTAGSTFTSTVYRSGNSSWSRVR